MGKRRVVLSGLCLVLAIGLLGLLSGCASVSNRPSANKGLLPAPMRAETGTEAAPVTVAPETPPPTEATDPDKLRVPEIPSLWPVDEDDHIILSSFGYRGGRRGCFHRAVDIRASMNAPVLAAAAGTIKKASSGGNYGKLVVVDHGNGYESLYAHLNEIDVEPGQKVACGERIGLAGRTGNATCPHVHYEILRKEEAVNPVEFLPMDGVHIEQFASLAPPASARLSKELASSKGSRNDAKGEKNAKKSGKALLAKKSSKEAPSRGKAAKEEVADRSDDNVEAKSSAKPVKTAAVEKKTSATTSAKAAKAAKADAENPKQAKTAGKSAPTAKGDSAKKAASTKVASKTPAAKAATKAETSKPSAKASKASAPEKSKAAKADTSKKATTPKKGAVDKKAKS